MLLYGVTASGKTEVYFKLIDDCLKRGKNVLFLAPEIALASQLTKRLAKSSEQKMLQSGTAVFQTAKGMMYGRGYTEMI